MGLEARLNRADGRAKVIASCVTAVVLAVPAAGTAPEEGVGDVAFGEVDLADVDELDIGDVDLGDIGDIGDIDLGDIDLGDIDLTIGNEFGDDGDIGDIGDIGDNVVNVVNVVNGRTLFFTYDPMNLEQVPAASVGPEHTSITLKELSVRVGRPDLWDRHVAATEAKQWNDSLSGGLLVGAGVGGLGALGLVVVSNTMGDQLTDRYGSAGAMFLPNNALPMVGALVLGSGLLVGAAMFVSGDDDPRSDIWAALHSEVDSHNARLTREPATP